MNGCSIHKRLILSLKILIYLSTCPLALGLKGVVKICFISLLIKFAWKFARNSLPLSLTTAYGAPYLWITWSSNFLHTKIEVVFFNKWVSTNLVKLSITIRTALYGFLVVFGKKNKSQWTIKKGLTGFFIALCAGVGKNLGFAAWQIMHFLII